MNFQCIADKGGVSSARCRLDTSWNETTVHDENPREFDSDINPSLASIVSADTLQGLSRVSLYLSNHQAGSTCTDLRLQSPQRLAFIR